MTYDLYSSIFIRYYILYILFVITLPLSIAHGKKISSFFIMTSFVFVILYLVIWKGLIIVTVILVIAIEGICILLLHWLAIHVQS